MTERLNHKMLSDFDEIRPYKDEEINQAVHRIIKEKYFQQGLFYLFSEEKAREILADLPHIHTYQDFQSRFVYQLLDAILAKSSDGLTCSGIEKLTPGKSYLFISNHKDIVLDSAFLNYLLLKYGHLTTEIAIGDNLLLMPWIVDFVKLNRSFIVHRNIPVKQMYELSMRLSAYISYTLKEKNISVWIAQREGRTKDGNDKTQVGLLKMLQACTTENYVEAFKSMEIVPVTITYEYHPCDLMMIREAHAQEFMCDKKDDLKSMATGVIGKKGRIHYTFGTPLTQQLDKLNHFTNKNDFIKGLAGLIDEQIYAGYNICPINYIAHDKHFQNDLFKSKYSPADEAYFHQYIEKQTESISPEHKELAYKYMFEMYANPLINKNKTTSCNRN